MITVNDIMRVRMTSKEKQLEAKILDYLHKLPKELQEDYKTHMGIE